MCLPKLASASSDNGAFSHIFFNFIVTGESSADDTATTEKDYLRIHSHDSQFHSSIFLVQILVSEKDIPVFFFFKKKRKVVVVIGRYYTGNYIQKRKFDNLTAWLE